MARRFIAVAAFAALAACGIKGPPRPPADAPPPPPIQVQPQTPMTLTPDAGCQGCAERGP